ncbi:MAG: hypothetical protein J6C84_01400 [Lachnospiraceae bacterium]|nr:hypothetical protein [Lachnospiraceae bacterium]
MNRSDLDRNAYMLRGPLAKRGYVRWYHSFKGMAPGTGNMRTFFVEYLILNPALGSSQPILGQHPYFKRRRMKPSYVMVKAGVFPDENGEDGRQLNAFYPMTSLKVTQSPFTLQTEDCFYSENRIAGFIDVSAAKARHRSLMTDAGCMEWDLEIHKAVSCHTGFIANPFFTAIGALNSFWHGEGIRSFFQGTVSLDGVVYEVIPDQSYGYADKHWGRSFNNPLLRLSSGHIVSGRTGRDLKHSALAVDGCCPKFLCFPLRRRLIIQLTYMGEDFEFHFARPGTLSRCKWKVTETNKRFIWHIMAQNKDAVLKLILSCTKEHLMDLTYENPDGSLTAAPLLGGGCGVGTIELYRRQAGSVQLIDTLSVKDALCEYQSQA